MFAPDASLFTFAPLLCRLLRLSLSAVSNRQLVCNFAGDGGKLKLTLDKDEVIIRFSAIHTHVTYPHGIVFHDSKWKVASDSTRETLCSSEQTGKIFLLIHDKLHRLLSQCPHLKMQHKVPYSFTTLPDTLSFLNLMLWVVFIARGQFVRCPGNKATLVVFDVPVDVTLGTHECPFTLAWPSLKVEKELRPDVALRITHTDDVAHYIRVEPGELSMDCVLVYLLSNIRSTLRVHSKQ